MCSCRGRGQGERWMQPARPRGSCIQGDAPWHVPPLPCCCGAEILLWHGRRGSDHILLSPRPRCHPVPGDRAGTESCGCGCAAPPSTPRSAGGGSAEKRSWKWGKKEDSQVCPAELCAEDSFLSTHFSTKWQQTARSSASERQRGRLCWQTPGAVLRPSSALAHSSSGRAPPGLVLRSAVPPALLDAPPPPLASSGCARGRGPGVTAEGCGARCSPSCCSPAHAAGPGCAFCRSFATSRGTSGRLHPRGPQPRGEAAASWPRDPLALAGGPELAGRQKKRAGDEP